LSRSELSAYLVGKEKALPLRESLFVLGGSQPNSHQVSLSGSSPKHQHNLRPEVV